MKILSSNQISRKMKRLAIEIYTNHIGEKEIYFAGINSKGNLFASFVADELRKICSIEIHQISILLNPADPFYACKPFLEIIPSKLEVAALIDRKHKLFPINVDYVGLSLATTLHDNIEVMFNENKMVEAYLG